MSDAWDWGRERKWDTVVRFASFISAAAEVGMHFLHARSTTRSIPCSYGHSLIYIGWLHMNECQLNNSFSTTCQMIIWTINNWAKKNELFSIEQLPRQSSTAFHVQGCQNSQLFHFYIFPKIFCEDVLWHAYYNHRKKNAWLPQPLWPFPTNEKRLYDRRAEQDCRWERFIKRRGNPLQLHTPWYDIWMTLE